MYPTFHLVWVDTSRTCPQANALHVVYNKAMKNKLHLQKYENKWVAVNEDQTEIIAAADSIKKLSKALDKLEDTESIITFIPKIDSYLSPYGLL